MNSIKKTYNQSFQKDKDQVLPKVRLINEDIKFFVDNENAGVIHPKLM